METKEKLLKSISEMPKFVKKDLYFERKNAEGNADYVMEKRLIGITEENKYNLITTVSKFYKVVQFEDVYRPIVEHFEDAEGDTNYFFGTGVLKIFPNNERFKTEDGNKIGIVICNSVNKALAISINFCIMVSDSIIYLPNGISGFRKLHLGKVDELVTDYEKFIVEVNKSWSTIISCFSRELTQNDVDTVLVRLKLGIRYDKKIKKAFEVVQGLKLWDLFIELVDSISERNYKREENKIAKIKRIAEVVKAYAVMERL